MMKILHTSDWHLGHTLYNYDRTEEQQSMIDQMVDIAGREKPDVFLLSGDVYHTAQPSASTQTLFSEAIMRLHTAHPGMVIIATAGNHDSGSRHEVFRKPWQALGVYAIGCLDHNHPETHIIDIPGKGKVIALPYCHERNLPDGIFQQLIDLATDHDTTHLPVVMMAHTTVRGCDFTGHQDATDLSVGGIDTLNIEDLGTGYDYLALGHIHHAQFIHTGRHNVRYSGTPIAVGFDEAYEHSVSLVEIDRHGDKPRVKTIAIDNPHPLVTLPSKGFDSWDKALQLLKDFPDDIPAYIRLNVETDTFLPSNANMDAQAAATGKRCRFCVINARRKDRHTADEKVLTVEEFQEEKPIDIARRYAEDKGVDFDDDMQELFNQALALTQQDNPNL